MPIFAYQARDLQGIDHKGTIETIDPSSAARILGRKGLIVTKIKEVKASGDSIIDKYLHRVSFTDLVVATRQLATMVESGLVLSEALDILVEQQSSAKFKEVLHDVSRDIKSGIDLATAFKKHPDVFPPLYSNLVKAGEQAGNLDVILTELATNLEKDKEFRSKIRGALIYPILVVIMMIVVMLVMLVFVIPKLTSLYTQSNIDLPLPTKILIFTSNSLVNYWWLILGIIVGISMLFQKWVSTKSGRLYFDTFILKIPIVGSIIRGTALTNFTRTFGLLTTAGIPILDSLNIVKEIIGNMVYKNALELTYTGVERGLPFSTQLEACGVFPNIVSQMFKVGEETGKVDKVSFKLADYYEDESDNLVKNLTVAIEPIVLIILGVGVGFLVLSIILPIYKLTTNIS